MELTKTQRERIFDAVKENRKNYDSDTKHATALGLSKAWYSAIKNGDTERVSMATLVTLARRLNVSLRSEMEWKAAETPVFTYITQQLEYCQQSSLSGLLCDVPNIGKTFTAKAYVRTHKNAIYVDCGQVKTKMRMIRHIAKEFGVNFNGRYADVYDDLVYYLKSIERPIIIDCGQVKTKMRMIRHIAKEFGVNFNGRYADVYDDLVYYLKSIERPIIILDEAGDIAYETFEELKALWNATEHCCGWFMMGANGLKKKIRCGMERETNSYEEMFSRYGGKFNRITPEDQKERTKFLEAQSYIIKKIRCGMERETNSYEEMFSRYGGKFNRITPEDQKERTKFLEAQSYIIAKLNCPEGGDVRQIMNRAGGNLRRVYTEIEKQVLNGREN